MEETPARDIQAIEPVDGVDPHRACPILVNRSDVVVSQALAVVWVMPVMRESIPGGVEPVEPPVSRAHPQNAGTIFIDQHYGVFCQTARVSGVVAVLPETVPVVAVHAVIRAQPKKTVVVLSERKDPLLKRLTANRESVEADILFLDYRKPLDSAIPRGGGGRLHPIGEDKNHCNRQKGPSQSRY